MKWICLPQTLRVPDIFDLSELWYNPDSERLVLVGSSALVLVEKANLFPTVRIGENTLSLQNGLYNGTPWFANHEAGAVFFSSLARGGNMVYRENGGIVEPRSIVDPDTGEDTGDAWFEGSWSFSAFGTSFPNATLSAHGSASGSVTVETVWPHWRKAWTSKNEYRTNLGGAYSPLAGASGTVSLGVPAWRRNTDNRVFIRRSNGELSTPDGDAKIIATQDGSGWLTFSDAPDLRLLAYPEAGRRCTIYTLAEDGSISTVGGLVSLGTEVVPYLPSASGVLPYDLYSATVPQWM